MTDTATELKPADKIKAVCAELGLTMTAEFVPFSKSRNAKPRAGSDKPWRSLNWKVTLQRAGKAKAHNGTIFPDVPREILTTDYAAGAAHCPSYKTPVKFPSGNVDRWSSDNVISYEIENGRARSGNKPIMPDMVDVIASLVLDSNVLDASSFEEWASDYGYDTDSRTAETTYRACLEIALKLRNGIGEAGLAKLRDACQDY